VTYSYHSRVVALEFLAVSSLEWQPELNAKRAVEHRAGVGELVSVFAEPVVSFVPAVAGFSFGHILCLSLI